MAPIAKMRAADKCARHQRDEMQAILDRGCIVSLVLPPLSLDQRDEMQVVLDRGCIVSLVPQWVGLSSRTGCRPSTDPR